MNLYFLVELEGVLPDSRVLELNVDLRQEGQLVHNCDLDLFELQLQRRLQHRIGFSFQLAQQQL